MSLNFNARTPNYSASQGSYGRYPTGTPTGTTGVTGTPTATFGPTATPTGTISVSTRMTSTSTPTSTFSAVTMTSVPTSSHTCNCHTYTPGAPYTPGACPTSSFPSVPWEPTPSYPINYDWSQTTLTPDTNGNYLEEEKNAYYQEQLNPNNLFSTGSNIATGISQFASGSTGQAAGIYGAGLGVASTVYNVANGDYAAAAGSAVSTAIGCTVCGGLYTAGTIMYNNGENFYNSPEYDDWVNYNEANAWEME